MNKKFKLSLLSASVLLAIAGPAKAETFCGDRSNVGFTWAGTYENETMGAEDCYEVGIFIENGQLSDHALATNMIMDSGSKMSVLGHFENSKVNTGAEVYITKNTQIATDGYLADAPALATNIAINGGLIRVFDGGTLKDSVINGGTVYASNSGDADDAGKSINNTVNNGGKLFVYLGGTSEGTTVNNGGYEYVQQTGTSLNTKVNNGGNQFLTSQGVATATTVENGGLQQATGGATAKNSIIKLGGKQTIANGGMANGAQIYGTQSVFSNTADGSIATNSTVHTGGVQSISKGGKAETVTLLGNAKQNINANASAKDVTINDQAQSTVQAGAQLLGATQVNGQGTVRLVAAGGLADATAGALAESISLNSANATLFVYSSGSDANTATVGQLKGSGKVKFVTADPLAYSRLDVNELSGKLHFMFNTSIADGRGDYLTVQQGSGQHKVSVLDSGAEITDPINTKLDLITDKSAGASFALAKLDGTPTTAVDGGAYMYTLDSRVDGTDKIWFLTSNGSYFPIIPGVPGVPGGKITAPATDAILSLAAAPVLMMNNEMSNLRFRRGELKASTEGYNTWGRLLTGKDEVSAGYAQFDLKQSGFELGADKRFETDRGQVFVGLSGNYSSADIKHQRRGTSKSSSYGIGMHTTYFDQTGLYVDGLIKYNNYSNDLRAVSTNGSSVRGDYKQGAVGAALEVGYNTNLTTTVWAEPYAKLSMVQAGGKDMLLNNGMSANIGAQKSVASELGVSIGKEFKVNSKSSVSPYAKLAWSHEFQGDNNTTINHVHNFKTNFSGDVGKVGLGVNANLLSDALNLYGEFNYAKGSKVDSPFKFNFGVRYSF